MTFGALISGAALRDLLDTTSDVVLLDTRAAGYDEGHLPGAVRADLNRDLSAASDDGFDAANGGRHPLPSRSRWLATLGRWGIAPETSVVVYDDQSGANAASRAWWMLRAVGHDRVAVLDGGLAAAVTAGISVSDVTPSVQHKDPYPATEWKRPVVDMREVDALRLDPSWRVLDVRSAERFRGDVEPIDPIAGHIPGAVNLPFPENLKDGVYRTPDELRRQYLDFLGDLPPEHLIVHCGSGVTACHTLLALEIAGLPGASLYVGSWSEWCRNPMPRIP